MEIGSGGVCMEEMSSDDKHGSMTFRNTWATVLPLRNFQQVHSIYEAYSLYSIYSPASSIIIHI